MTPAGRQRLAAIVLGALSLAAPSCNRDSSQRPVPDRETVAAVLGSRRFVEPRLTGGFRYAPVSELSTTPRDVLPAEEQRELLRAADSIRRDDRPLDPESRHTAGLLDLALGEIDSAVAHLRRAAAEAPRNGEILSDLAAAYLVRAAEKDNPIDLAAALDAAERAVELSPGSPEALFNRALARQRLSLTGEAVKGWQEYLERETDPGWSREAKAALQRLQAPSAAEVWEAAKPRLLEAARKGDQKTVTTFVGRFRQEARTLGEGEILLAWADHSRRRDLSSAAVELTAARVIGRTLARLSGESMLADTVAGIDAALRDDPERLRALVEGVLSYRAGSLALDDKDKDIAKATASLEHASQRLRWAGSPLAAWADFGLVRCAYQDQAFKEAQRRALELLTRLDPARSPVLMGRTRWVLGASQMAIARPAEALASYQLALPFFERTRETAHEATIHSRLASAYNELGDWRSAWRHRAHALQVLGRYRNQSYRVALINVALGALDAGYTHAALVLQTESVNLAWQRSDPEQLANSLINRASILARTGLADPENDLNEARESCDLIPDPSIRQSILADLLAVEGQAFQRKDSARALRALDQAVEMYRGSDRLIMLPPVLHTRAATLQALGHNADAERDLQDAIEELETGRGSVPDAEQRASFIARASAGAIFDSMVRLQHEQGRGERALEYSERRRARLLLDWLSADKIEAKGFQVKTWSRSQPLPEMRQSLPDGVALLVSELLPDRLLLWVVRRDGLDLRHVKVPAAQVEARVRLFKAATSGPEEKLRPAAAAVYELLVAPVAELLAAGETLVFVPESPLDSIPFGLLFDAKRGRYLIEDRPVAVSPSLNLFTRLTQKARPHSFANADLLAIADPAFDRTRHPRLKRLPGATEEAHVIRSLFARAHIVPGRHATREVLLGGMGRYQVLHFGGHTLVNAAKPLLSSLLLAPGGEAGDSGVLYAREIIGAPDGDTDLVVLSSCRSAGGAELPAEGVAGLVWPFFSRGASMVIASTREVRDDEAARLFTSFYHHLAAGEPPLSALRKAQLETLAANRSAGRQSFDWGVFQLYGAVPGADTLEKGAEP